MTGIAGIELSERDGECSRAVGVAGGGDLGAVRGGVEEVLCVGIEDAKSAGELGEQVAVRARGCEGMEEHAAAVHLEAPASRGSILGTLDTLDILRNVDVDDR